jgi:hypothetical protein
VGFPCIATPQEFKKAMAAAVESSRTPKSVIETRDVHLSPSPAIQATALFDVQIVDPKTGLERWVEVKAVDSETARQRAVGTGAIVGDVRLKSIG